MLQFMWLQRVRHNLATDQQLKLLLLIVIKTTLMATQMSIQVGLDEKDQWYSQCFIIQRQMNDTE